MYKLILGLLIVLSAVAIACGDDDDDATDASDSTPEATAESTETAVDDTGGTTDSSQLLAETFSSSQLPIAVTVSPGPGFFVPDDADLVDIFAVVQTDFPNGYIDFLQPTQVYNYPSETESELAEPPADYVQWFNDIPFDVVTATEDVTVGGLSGTRLTVANPNNESFSLFELDGGEYHLSYQDTLYVYVLDADGTQVLTICGTENGRNFAEFQDTCEAAVATAEFGG